MKEKSELQKEVDKLTASWKSHGIHENLMLNENRLRHMAELAIIHCIKSKSDWQMSWKEVILISVIAILLALGFIYLAI